jgi:hypothetical protein
VIHQILESETNPFYAVIWFSARDIDLLQEGAKTVRPTGIARKDFADQLVRILEPAGHSNKSFDREQFMARQLADSSDGQFLFVFDNFETVVSPNELFSWVDECVRSQNKVLITTRIRDAFAGDYPVEIKGMSENECNELIDSVASAFGVQELISPNYRDEVILESGGHPYIIKILLGEVAKQRKAVKVERIIAAQERILEALFDRTYQRLSPSARRIFLTLCSWRSAIESLALEAVILRPGNEERISVRAALDELRLSSLIEEHQIELSTEIEVPLAATLFGRKKLSVSEWRMAIERDSELLQLFGAKVRGSRGAYGQKQVRRLFESAARIVAENKQPLKDVVPLLEFLASQVPDGWLALADLYTEFPPDDGSKEKECVSKYLEVSGDSDVDGWLRLADLCARTSDVIGEVHALTGVARIPNVSLAVLSDTVNRFNRVFKQSGVVHEGLDRTIRQDMTWTLIKAMEQYEQDLSANDCARLGWLYMKVEDLSRAKALADRGLEYDPYNDYCAGLSTRLENQWK